MFTVQYFRELISDRLTVAALDIFAEFEKTIIQYEEAMERQRRLLTALRQKPATKAAPQLCPAAPPPQSNCEQRSSPDLNQEAPTPELREIKKEEEELCSSQEDELLFHQATITAISDESKDESEVSEEVQDLHRLRIPKIHLHRIDFQQHSVQRKEEAAVSSPSQQSCCSVDQSPPEPLSFAEGLLSVQLVLKQEPEDGDGYKPEPQKDLVQSDSSSEAVGQKPQARGPHDTTSAGNSKLRKKRRIVADSCPPLENSCSSEINKKLLTCDLCDKSFKYKSLKKKHDRGHKGGMRHFCRTCGKGFTLGGDSLAHSRTHVRKRICPFGEHKSSIRNGSLWARIRNHNLWRRFSCKLCGKSFIQSGSLLVHMKVHTGEKLFS